MSGTESYESIVDGVRESFGRLQEFRRACVHTYAPFQRGVMECTRCGILHVLDPPPEPSVFARAWKYLKGVVGC